MRCLVLPLPPPADRPPQVVVVVVVVVVVACWRRHLASTSPPPSTLSPLWSRRWWTLCPLPSSRPPSSSPSASRRYAGPASPSWRWRSGWTKLASCPRAAPPSCPPTLARCRRWTPGARRGSCRVVQVHGHNQGRLPAAIFYISFIFSYFNISFNIFIVWVDYRLLLGTELIRKAPEKIYLSVKERSRKESSQELLG